MRRSGSDPVHAQHGSYLVTPAKLPHSNSQPEEVLMFVEQSGRFDNKPMASAAR